MVVTDCTNFPNTVVSEDDRERAVPFELLGVKARSGEEKATSLLDVQYRSYEPGSAKINAERVTSIVDVKLCHIQLTYVQRPVLRMLDYILEQALGPVFNPELFLDERSVKNVEMLKQRVKSYMWSVFLMAKKRPFYVPYLGQVSAEIFRI